MCEVVLVACGLISGSAVWVGSTMAGAGMPVINAVGLGINVPSAVVIASGGRLAFGVSSRSTAVATYGLHSWSLLVELLSGVAHVNHWILDSSVLHQMAPAPGSSINWQVDGVMMLVARFAFGVGIAGFARRDLSGK